MPFFDLPGDPLRKRKKTKKKAAPKKKRVTPKKKRVTKKAKKKTPRKKSFGRTARKRKPARRYPSRKGTWALTNLPTGFAIVSGVGKKSKLKELAGALTRIRGANWADGGALLRASFSTRPPKWFVDLGKKVEKLVNKYAPDRKQTAPPGSIRPSPLPWTPGAGRRRWVKEDVFIAGSPDKTFVIQAEVLYPNRLWAISRTLEEASASPVNPPARQRKLLRKNKR